MSQINFLPESFQKHYARSRRRPIEFGLIAATLAGLVLLWLSSGGPDPALAEQVDQMQREIDQIQQLHDEQIQLDSQRSELQRRLMIARETYQPIGMTQAIARISQRTPESIRIVSLELQNDRPAPEPLPDTNANNTNRRVIASAGSNQTSDKPRQPSLLKITLTGHAPNDEAIVELIRALDRDPVFSTVSLRGSRVEQTRTHIVREFRLDVVIDLDRRFIDTRRTGEAR